MGNIIWMSLLSGLSTPLGSLLVIRYHRTLMRAQGVFWGIAAGIMTTLVLIELMPSAIQMGGRGLFFSTAFGGIVLMLLLRNWLAQRIDSTASLEMTAVQTNFLEMGWFVAVAIALHDLPEGIAIAAGDAVHPNMGILIAVAIAVHNIPEGMSVAFPLFLAGVKPRKIFWLSVWIGTVTPIGTVLSLWFVHISTNFIAISLALASGTMLLVVFREVLPEALRLGKRQASLGGAIGALLMVWLASLHI
ncbi:ZIP family metal transporter [Alicyclobacillus sp. SO9]|uniref:ZIP family metal transporter n=1 Tax=Alicyclobacillus sp. SO9 TaxID=2665646 RepID=UPI0018E6DEBA|nr:ZIP family metal transporter [Alicyclobacillus sp. SO9]